MSKGLIDQFDGRLLMVMVDKHISSPTGYYAGSTVSWAKMAKIGPNGLS
jgi:hypothetical protein